MEVRHIWYIEFTLGGTPDLNSSRKSHAGTQNNKKAHRIDGLLYMVGDIGLEPMTFATSMRRSSQLS